MITIDYNRCKTCGSCIDFCPITAISMVDDVVTVSEMPCKSPCRDECPIHMNIPGYLYYISEGNFKEAYKVIRETNPLPAICGRVCHHPCEEACNRSLIDQPLAIASLKRFVSDQIDIEKLETPQIEGNGKKVAIVGSGPAGLAAAHDLALLGYEVTIFEELPESGGMLRVGIPDYRLPKHIVREEINYIERLGVKIKTNSKVGEQIQLNDLRKSYQAIFVATGAHKEMMLGIPGEQLQGVIRGFNFLRAINMGDKVEIGKRVVIIGGGNIAIDVALSALRLGAKEVEIFCLEKKEEMPAHEWGIENAIKEGIKINYRWGPKYIEGKNGRLTGVSFKRCTMVFDVDGRFNPSYDERETTATSADSVIVAIGQVADLSFLGEESSLTTFKDIAIKADNFTLETNLTGVFAGGDAVKGPSSVVDAIADGKRAACSIFRYLSAETMSSHEEKGDIGKLSESEITTLKNLLPYTQQVKMSELENGERFKDFSELMKGYTIDQAFEEAKRCLKSCINCEVCMNICPVKAISMNLGDGK